MTSFYLDGDHRSLLTHLGLYGLAALLADRGVPDLTLSWDGPAARVDAPTLDAGLVDDTVRAHAAEHTAAESWAQQHTVIAGAARGAMSPRLTRIPDHDTWTRVQTSRHDALDTLTAQRAWLDLRLLAALGEPSYWTQDRREGISGQDQGASRFEMQPRNGGGEIVTSRLRPLARAVADRAAGHAAAGIAGDRPVDELGRADGAASMTATGLAMPAPADNALVWCALWGIAALPRAPRVGGPAASAGHLTHDDGESFYTPVWAGSWRPARLRTVLSSAQLRTAATLCDQTHTGHELARGNAWLSERGVVGVVRFPVKTFDTSYTPTRRALPGDTTALAPRP